MEYAGFLLRQQRLARDWSQEGLCRGICTVSYLSKIEQGRAEPSEEILGMLMERLGIVWRDDGDEERALVERGYETLLSEDPGFPALVKELGARGLAYSTFGADFLLLEQFTLEQSRPLEEALEGCMDSRQLSLQRLLQGRCEEAARLLPCGFVLCAAGHRAYYDGNLIRALEWMHQAYHRAAGEGHPRIMLHSRIVMGNCYSNQRAIGPMLEHYRVARNLAMALGDRDNLRSIDYNIAASRLEAGEYREALGFFESLEAPRRMELHKKAICLEKLGRYQEAMETLELARGLESDGWMPEGLEEQMLELVALRLTDEAYLKSETYGKKLMDCFARCREELPSGYAAFHLPWVMEWLRAGRKYRQALELMEEFS